MSSPKNYSQSGIDRIRTTVFNIAMTNKQDVADIFAELDRQLDVVLEMILLHMPNYLQTKLIRRLAYVFNGHISNKNVLRTCPKSFNFNSTKSRDQKIIQTTKFSILDFLWNTQSNSLQSIRNLHLHRAVLESVVEDIFSKLKYYRNAVSKCGMLHNHILSHTMENVPGAVTQEYNQILSEVHALEAEQGVEQMMMIGTYHQLVGMLKNYYALREKLAEPYLRLVYSIANKLSKQEGHIEDNFQNGVMGLYKAISNFDITKKTNFSTYAKPWIRQSIMANISQENIIRVPASTWREQAAYVKDLASGKSMKDTAIKHGVKEHHIEQIMHKADIGQVMRVDWSSFVGDVGEAITFDDFYQKETHQENDAESTEIMVELSLTEQEDLVLFLMDGIDTVGQEAIKLLSSRIEEERMRQKGAKNAMGNSVTG